MRSRGFIHTARIPGLQRKCSTQKGLLSRCLQPCVRLGSTDVVFAAGLMPVPILNTLFVTTFAVLQNSRCPCHPFPIHVLPAFWLKTLAAVLCKPRRQCKKNKSTYKSFNALKAPLRMADITLTGPSTMAGRKTMAGGKLFSAAIQVIKKEAARSCASVCFVYLSF